MRVLMIDNYDSFTYNLVQYLQELGAEVLVHRNDQITIEDIEALNPDRLMVSPGPCTPNEAGVSIAAIKHFAGKLPILGVCLGHQSIGQAFGGKVVRARQVMHGKTSPIHHSGVGIFRDLPSPYIATGTIPWWWKKTACRIVWRLPPGPRTTTAAWTRSWGCGTRPCPLKGCSITPSPF